jgi:hypothetical protein
MLETFGARLRQRREEQAIALITIADQTKIKLSLLEALERDDVSHWPSGIFRRAFIRAYAHAIALNPDVVVREFLEVHPEPVEVIAAASAIASGADGARVSGGPPIRLRYLVGSAIDSLSRLRRSPAGGDPVAADRPPAEFALPAIEAGLKACATETAALAEAGLKTGVADTAALAEADPKTGPTETAALAEADLKTCAAETAAAPSDLDFLAAAQLCTELGRVENASDVQPLLQDAVTILDAIGLIVWVWDGVAEELRPALAHGYSDRVLAQLPTVGRDADNATAAAFRSAQTCAINGSDHSSGALAVPLLTPAGCAGVLAIELQHGSEQTRSVRAVATIFAAQLAQLIGGARPAEVRPQPEVMVPPVASFTSPIRRVRR